MKLAAGLLLATAAFGADAVMIEKGREEEKKSCQGCHGLRIVQTQRLSRAAWDRELTKMTGWGTEIGRRDALLEYLIANFGDDKPAPAPVLSGDGTKSK